MSLTCKKCGTTLADDSQFCYQCGEKVTVYCCPKCGKALPEDSKFCGFCGSNLDGTDKDKAPQPHTQPIKTPEPEIDSKKETQPTQSLPPIIPPCDTSESAPLGGFPQSEAMIEAAPCENVDCSGDLSEIVGKNKEYYLRQFQNVQHGQKAKFNWSAFFFGPSFCFYRKSKDICWQLYKLPLIIVGICAVLLAISALIISSDVSAIMWWSVVAAGGAGLLNIYLLVTAIHCGKSFNAKYYQHCLRLAKNSKENEKKFGVSAKNAILSSLVIYVSVCLVCALLALFITSVLIGKGEPKKDDVTSGKAWGETVQESTPLTDQDVIGTWQAYYARIDGVEYNETNFGSVQYIFREDGSGSSLEGGINTGEYSWHIDENTVKIVAGNVTVTLPIADGILTNAPNDNYEVLYRKVDTAALMPETAASPLSAYVGTWYATSSDPDNTYNYPTDAESSYFEGIALALYELNGTCYAGLSYQNPYYPDSYDYTLGNDNILPITQVSEKEFLIEFDCLDTGEAWQSGTIGKLLLTINPVGKLFAEMQWGENVAVSKMPLTSTEAWLNGQYASYDYENSSSYFYTSDDKISPLECEPILGDYFYGGWSVQQIGSSADTIAFGSGSIYVDQIFLNFYRNSEIELRYREIDDPHTQHIAEIYFDELYIDGTLYYRQW